MLMLPGKRQLMSTAHLGGLRRHDAGCQHQGDGRGDTRTAQQAGLVTRFKY
jgi:hypothetical protein